MLGVLGFRPGVDCFRQAVATAGSHISSFKREGERCK